MSEDENKKKKLIITEVDKIPLPQHRNELYDQALQQALEATKDTISIQIEDKTANTIFPGIQFRVIEYNQNADRQWDLLVAQRKEAVFIHRQAKDSLPKKQGT